MGSGPEQERLVTLAKSLQINHAIEWIQWVEHDQMPSIYRAADAFLFPSHEGAGMVVFEAMSYGIPVLCLEGSGPAELTKNNGILAPYSNPEETIAVLANHLVRLQRQPFERHLRQRILTCFIRNKHTWKQRGHEICAVKFQKANQSTT